jgi:DDE domain
MTKISDAGYRFPPEIIQQAIWLYLRFTLSFRDVEDLLAERGIVVSYETVRRWVNHFGPMIAADLRKRRPKPHSVWHLDEVYLKIGGRMVYLWRAVDGERCREPPICIARTSEGGAYTFDSLVLAVHEQLLLITDDQSTREFGRIVGFTASTWLHNIFSTSLDRRIIDLDKFVRMTAELVNSGHNYLGVSAAVLTRCASLDAQAGVSPGPLFSPLSKLIGGKAAEAQSHLVIVGRCIRETWSNPSALIYREPITGVLLRQLIRERQDDYAEILSALLFLVRDRPDIVSYIHHWARGHFLPPSALH